MRKDIETIANNYTLDNQLLKISEELQEFSLAITRFRNDPSDANYINVIEEMADVSILSQEIRHLLNANWRVSDFIYDAYKKYKIQRQLNRIVKERENTNE